jgi:hypothetical protein
MGMQGAAMNKQLAITAGVVAFFGAWVGVSYLLSHPGDVEATPLVRHISTPIFGCKSRDTADHISRLLGQHQRAAAVDFVRGNIATGECDELQKGEAIAVVQSGIGMVKVQRPGEAAGYWTISEAVGP